jgi:hypothetical protein
VGRLETDWLPAAARQAAIGDRCLLDDGLLRLASSLLERPAVACSHSGSVGALSVGDEGPAQTGFFHPSRGDATNAENREPE